MKTKTKLTLLAFAAISFNTIRAEELLVDTDGDGYADSPVNLCGGADDDQKAGPRTTGSICGTMDDDQIVGGDGADFVKPFAPPSNPDATSHYITSSQGPYQMQTPGYLTSVQYPYGVTSPAPSPAGVCAVGTIARFYTSSQGPYQAQSPAPQANGLTSVQYPYKLTSDPLGMTTDGGGWTCITGDSGADTLYGGNVAGTIATGPIVNKGIESDPFGISGGSPANLKTNQQTDHAILQLMTTGNLHGDDYSDTLRGYSGGDDLIYGKTGSDSLYGGNGADTLWGDNGTDSIVRRAPSPGFVFGTTSY